MGILDMLLGNGQPDPMMVAAQMGGTPQQVQDPNFSPTGPNQPGVNAGSMVPNPAYATLQQQLQAAQAAQNKRALEMGLIQGGASIMGARTPQGYPAPIGSAIGQGITGGVGGAESYLQNAREMSKGLLGAQQAGGQMALNQYDLQTKAYLMQHYGVADKDALALITASKSAAAQAQMIQQLLQDPKVSDQAKGKLALDLAQAQTGTPVDTLKLGEDAYGKTPTPLDPSVVKKNEAMTREADAQAKYYDSGGAGGGGSLTTKLDPKLEAESLAEWNSIMKNQPELAKAVGTGPNAMLGPDWIAQQKLAQAGRGPYPAYLPPLEVTMKAAAAGTLHPGDHGHYGGVNMVWTGRYWIPMGGPPASGETPGEPAGAGSD